MTYLLARPDDPRCVTQRCNARFSQQLHDTRSYEGGNYSGWYFPDGEYEHEDVPVHGHRPVSPYLVAASERHDDLRKLASQRNVSTPQIESLSGAAWEEMTRKWHSTSCDSCGGEEAWTDCSTFCPARLQGICSTLWVTSRWVKEGGSYRLEVWVLYLAESGPIYSYDRIGPFGDVPAAYMWAATVAGAEIARESGV